MATVYVHSKTAKQTAEKEIIALHPSIASLHN